MINLFKKYSENKPPKEEEYASIETEIFYEIKVISSDYDVDDPDNYPYHKLFPHGSEKIVYTYDGEIVESYEGELDAAQYSGEGKLIKNGEVFEDTFKENKFVG